MPRGSRKHRKKRSLDQISSNQQDHVEVSLWPPVDHAADASNSEQKRFSTTTHERIQSIDELNDETCRVRFQSLHNVASPTPIQSHTWPILTQAEMVNLIAIAPTGSGKTFAYGLPLKSRTLVITPTRELTQQVAGQLNRLSGMNALSLHGGRGDKEQQCASIRTLDAWTVLVATPGRLLDILETETSILPCDLDTVVLDEADRLAVDRSLREQVDTILSSIPCLCRTLLVSATHPNSVTDVWKQWIVCSRPTVIVRSDIISHLKNNDSTLARIPPHIQQIVHVCSDHKKRKKLLRTLEAHEDGAGIIFFATIQALLEMARFLQQQQPRRSITVCHGQLPQQERDKILKRPFELLLATDLAARGIDCANVRFVIQFDFPSNLQQYVHRCGRIRGTVQGKAYAFFSRRFRSLAGDLVDLLESCGQDVDPNLRLLVSPNKKQRVEQKPNRSPRKESKGIEDDSLMSDEDEFEALSGQRIVLKRNPNVSEASDSSSE